MARFSSILSGIVVVLTLSTTLFAYSGGSGTPEDPYQIATVVDWQELMTTSADWDKSFILMDDIDLAGVPLTPIAPDTDNTQSLFQGTPFSGIFDGNGHIIRNAVITQPSSDYVGLFGYCLGTGSQIRNLGVENIQALGRKMVGGLVGSNGGYWHSNFPGGSITSCYATGTVSDTGIDLGGQPGEIGGLVGFNNQGTISSCYATGNVSGIDAYVGGLVGGNYNGKIISCFTTGTVTGTDAHVGGLVGSGSSNASTITDCHSTSNVTGAGGYVGGLVGIGGQITSCYATGNVTGTGSSYGPYVGGLVGIGSQITSCYATGNVTGAGGYVGGLVGSGGYITSCYATGNVTGTGGSYGPYVGGLVGRNENGMIITSYATGAVTGTGSVGGLVAAIENCTITSCFWDIETSGTTDGVGNRDPDPVGAMGRNTNQMKTESTFTGWDFTKETQNGTLDIWAMPKKGYPILSWQNQYPVVDAGADVELGYPTVRVQLSGHIEDSTVPNGIMECVWSVANGPRAVVFEPNEFVIDPVVILSLPGAYVLRLTADDGQLQAYDEVTITYLYGVLFVDSSATGANTGSSWANAFTSLQDALTMATPGTEIRVAQGTYKPDQFNLLDRVSRGRIETFELKSGVILKGGYAGIAAINPDDRDPIKYPTILSGDLAGNDNPATTLANLRSDPTRTDNTYHVLTAVGVDNTASLDGFIISGGHADSATAPDHRGGGLNIEQSSPTVTNCIFTRNYGSIGGAVCTRNAANAVFSACRFVANAGYSGGAVLNDANVTFTDCTFTGNYAAFGGGLLAEAPTKLTRCLIAQNTATFDGGGIQNYASPTTLTNCTLADNSAGRSGGGVFSVPAGKFNIVNSILWGNKASGIADKAAQLTGGTAAIYYCTIQDWDGSDPLFADPAAGDYRLRSHAGRYDPVAADWVLDAVTSPAIDTGSPFDPVGSEPAPNGGRINQGFDGGTEFASKSPNPYNIADLNRDGVVNLLDLAIVAENWLK